MVTCPVCRAQNPERARYCIECGTPLRRQGAEAREVRKTVTVLFSDVTGSTALGERLDAESVRRVMTSYFERVERVVTRHGGTVEKFIGDAVMAVFGIPQLHEDDAVRAVRAAWDARHELEGLNDELERSFGVRIQQRSGVNTGEVVAGSMGGGPTMATGDTVNVAARLEQSAEPGEILLGAATQRLVRDAVRSEALPPLPVRGKSAPLVAFRLLEVFPELPGHARRLDTPLVGRDQELRLFDRVYRRTVDERGCQLLTVIGEAGIGKTRLVADAVARRAGAATVIHGECPPYGEAVTFWPVAKAVRQAIGVTETGTPADAVAKLTAVLQAEDDGELLAGRLAQLLGAGGEPAPVDVLAWALRRLLETMARQRPLIVVFEDLHWAEATFLDLVDYVADWSRDAPILLVCTARPELLDRRPGWGSGKPNSTTVRLDPLTDDESAVLLGHLLGQGPLPGSARAAINRVAEGNPLFVEELISVLIEEGLLRREGGRWKATVDLTTIDIPPSINLVLAARLDHLGAEGRILQRASVEGKLFDRPAVVAISPAAERPVVAESLLTLARRDLIRPEPSGLVTPHGFQFRHMLLRDAAYASLPKRERAELHELFAAWLNGEAAARAVEYEELVGQHLEAAYRYRFALGPVNAKSRELARQAARQLTVAGRRALAREDMPAASNLLARAAELTGHGEASARLLHELGTAFIGVGKLAEADVVLREAREAAVAAGDAHLEAHVLVTRLRLDLEVEPASVAVADREVGRVIRTFEAMGDEGGLARAWRLLASAHWHRAQAADSEAALAQAAIHAQAAADTDEEVTILGDLTGVALLGPTPVDDGIRRCEEALAKSKGHPSQEGRALRALGGMRGMLGDFEEARRLLGRSIEILDDLGLALWLGGALQVLGEVEMMADDPLAAEGAFRRSYDLFVRGGNRSYMATAAALLATALCALGRDEEAEELTGVSEAAAAADDVDTQMLWRAARAKVFAARGRLDEALRLGWAAVHVGRRTDFHASAGLLLDLAQILVAAGRRHEAVEVVGEALDMCQRKGNLVWAARAGGVLADLTG